MGGGKQLIMRNIEKKKNGQLVTTGFPYSLIRHHPNFLHALKLSCKREGIFFIKFAFQKMVMRKINRINPKSLMIKHKWLKQRYE